MELSEQSLRRILTEQREEYQTYLSIVAKDFKSQVQLVSEVLAGQHEELVALRELVEKNTRDIEIMKVELEMVRSELSIIRSDLKAKAGRDELAVLEARVAKLELSARTKQ